MNAAQAKMVRVRSDLIKSHPFWGVLSLHLKVEEKQGIDTMQTDGEHLWYNPEFVLGLNEKKLTGCVAHEVSHCAFNHHTRRGNRDPSLWNQACDYSINRDLQRAGFELPGEALTDARFDNMSADEVFAVLKREKEKEEEERGEQSSPQRPNQGQGQPPGQGTGQSPPGQAQGPQGPNSGAQKGPQGGSGTPGGGSDPGGCGEVLDAAPAAQGTKLASIEGEWKVRVNQAIAAERGAGEGRIPGEMARMFEAIKKEPIDWRETLRRFIDDKQRVDYSWMRPNKRLLGQGYIVPGFIPNGINHIGAIFDSSGSTYDPKIIGRFLSEMQAALDDGITQKVTIVSCDTRIYNPQEFTHGDDVTKYEIKGGGGTMFSPALTWFANHHPDVAALIYFTDLDCTDFGEEPYVPVLWAAVGQMNVIRKRAEAVPFGEVVFLVD